MGLQLMLDGKPIGLVDDSGKLLDAEGTPVVKPERANQLTVPLPGPPPRTASEESDEDEPDEEDESGEEDEPQLDPKDPKDFQILQLKQQVNLFQKVIGQLQHAPPTQRTQELVQATKDLIEDHIPAGLDKDKDPFGLASTMKGMVKALNTMHSRLERLDQHTGFQAGLQMLETEKKNYDVFQDKRLGPIAEKVLQSELNNSNDPLPLLVQRVAAQFEGIATDGGKKYLKKKVDQLKKVPSALRKKDGASPSITVDKPKNVAEAKVAYQAWRSARDAATKKR